MKTSSILKILWWLLSKDYVWLISRLRFSPMIYFLFSIFSVIITSISSFFSAIVFSFYYFICFKLSPTAMMSSVNPSVRNLVDHASNSMQVYMCGMMIRSVLTPVSMKWCGSASMLIWSPTCVWPLNSLPELTHGVGVLSIMSTRVLFVQPQPRPTDTRNSFVVSEHMITRRVWQTCWTSSTPEIFLATYHDII